MVTELVLKIKCIKNHSIYRISSYNHSEQYWNLIAARLAFVVVFFFVVHSITAMIAWIVPDVPANLKFKMEREKQVVKQKLGVASDDEESEDEEDVTDKTSHETVLKSDI